MSAENEVSAGYIGSWMQCEDEDGSGCTRYFAQCGILGRSSAIGENEGKYRGRCFADRAGVMWQLLGLAHMV